MGLLIAGSAVSCTSENEDKKVPAHELPFKTITLNDFENFQKSDNNRWMTAGNVFMDRQTKHHCVVEEGKGLVVNQGDNDKRFFGASKDR